MRRPGDAVERGLISAHCAAGAPGHKVGAGGGAARRGAPPVRERPARTRGPGRTVMSEPIVNWLTDMDGVLVHEEHALPGAAQFISTLRERAIPFQILTNNSIFTPRDLAARLRLSGIEVVESDIWTSALATAKFLADQIPGGSAYAIGEAGLTTALYEQGYTLTDTDPDFVVLGETRTYSFEAITRAIRLIDSGSRYIATNPDRSEERRA